MKSDPVVTRLAKKLGVSRSTIRARRARGQKLDQPPQIRLSAKDQLAVARAHGTTEQVAARFGCSTSTVKRLRRIHGASGHGASGGAAGRKKSSRKKSKRKKATRSQGGSSSTKAKSKSKAKSKAKARTKSGNKTSKQKKAKAGARFSQAGKPVKAASSSGSKAAKRSAAKKSQAKSRAKKKRKKKAAPKTGR